LAVNVQILEVESENAHLTVSFRDVVCLHYERLCGQTIPFFCP
jgi:hypothetical protein